MPKELGFLLLNYFLQLDGGSWTNSHEELGGGGGMCVCVYLYGLLVSGKKWNWKRYYHILSFLDCRLTRSLKLSTFDGPVVNMTNI